MHRTKILAAALVFSLSAPFAASAQGYYEPRPLTRDIDATGTLGGRAPWNAPYEFDSGGDNDRNPALPYYQQGRGQQTGGPARNLLPDDGLHIVPR